jgi:putative acetyltransferase
MTQGDKFSIRRIALTDNDAVKEIIETVMPEFGADGSGFAIHDEEVKDMFTAYNNPKSLYLVVEQNGQVLGGAGINQLEGITESVCELKKMYFLPELRGIGLGSQVLKELLDFAGKHYDICYIETLNHMESALSLYKKFGFKLIDKPMGNTGHHGCNTWLTLSLSERNS